MKRSASSLGHSRLGRPHRGDRGGPEDYAMEHAIPEEGCVTRHTHRRKERNHHTSQRSLCRYTEADTGGRRKRVQTHTTQTESCRWYHLYLYLLIVCCILLCIAMQPTVKSHYILPKKTLRHHLWVSVVYCGFSCELNMHLPRHFPHMVIAPPCIF